jgi:uncharacterized membrane protein
MHKCVDKENKVISLGPDCMLYSSIKDLLVYMCVYSWTKRSLLQYISLQLLKTYAGLLARPIKCKRKQDLQVMMKRIHSCTAVRDGARNGVGVLCCVLVHTSIYLSLSLMHKHKHSKALLDASIHMVRMVHSFQWCMVGEGAPSFF